MATVYAATHRNGKRVAVKMLHPELSADPGIRERFLREGYVANKVGHRGAVIVDDDDVTADGAAFLVMELLDGEMLEARRERSPGGAYRATRRRPWSIRCSIRSPRRMPRASSTATSSPRTCSSRATA
jgi:serine/threonine protein kinase